MEASMRMRLGVAVTWLGLALGLGCPGETDPGPTGGHATTGSGAGGDIGDECVEAIDCGESTACQQRNCDNGYCVPLDSPAGTACDFDGGELCDGEGQCVPASCVDGFIGGDETDLDCGGECPPCENGLDCLIDGDCLSQICEGLTCLPCDDDLDCIDIPDGFCDADAHCGSKNDNGESCSEPAGCKSGFCADGTCCSTACDAACDECALDPGTCRLRVPGATGDPSCAPYVCNGTATACPSSCTNDNHCASGGYCDLATNTCVVMQKPLGASCVNGNECQSGNCVDGLCCSSPDCPGACNACNLGGNLGNCALRPNGAVCRATTGLCDPQEVCDGVAQACPGDAILPFGTTCRASTGMCDPVEVCNGVMGPCPVDFILPNGSVCRGSTGLCDPQEVCDGVGGACPNDTILPSGSVCRPSGGGCDPLETCDGTAGACPLDVLADAGLECRASLGVCDPAEQCDGVTPACPANFILPSGSECRVAGGECDPAEQCDGVAVACPTDAKSPAGTSCGAGVAQPVCNPDACNGMGSCIDQPPAGNGTACTNDNLFCSGAESCQAATCSSAGDPCALPLVCDEGINSCAAAWINELHYDNNGVDADEAVEIAGVAGTSLAGWSIAFYNGTGVLYATLPLTGTIPNQQNGFGTRVFMFPGIQNGPDGLALVSPSGGAVQLLSYEGSFTATNGPAVGLLSQNIGVSELSSTPLGQSLQLIGSGSSYSAFTWSGPTAHSRGAINPGQTF